MLAALSSSGAAALLNTHLANQQVLTGAGSRNSVPRESARPVEAAELRRGVMKRMIALVFVVAVFVSAALAPVAGAVPSPPSNGQGGGQLGPGNGQATLGSCFNSGFAFGAEFKCLS